MGYLRRGRGLDAGFTVIELMVVIGIVAVIASILTLGIRPASDSFALRRAGSIAMSELRDAQLGAIGEGADFAVEFAVSSPGALTVYRHGISVGGPIAVVSNGLDVRTVTVSGRTAGLHGAVLVEKLTLNGTTAVAGNTSFDWVYDVDVEVPDNARTVSIKNGASGPVLLTIPPSSLTPVPAIPWTTVRTVAAPQEWPVSVAITSGTTFPACPAPPGSASNLCAIFGRYGAPSAAGEAALQNRSGSRLRVVVDPATGRVSVQR